MTIVPLVGHRELLGRIDDALGRGTLPPSLLLQGPRGVGKQRIALWLGQRLLCQREGSRGACGACQGCRFALDLRHPDLHWYFPRPRLKDSDPEIDDVREDYAEAIAERAARHGLYAPPPGSEGIYVATVRAIVQEAVMSPAIGRRKVFIIGDAERMVPQEGSEQAANAFLKLLEEPPADTSIVLTSSEPGALLPTIRSRVVTLRVPLLSDDDVNEFLSLPQVVQVLAGEEDAPVDRDDQIAFAAGSPGRLLAAEQWARAIDNARRLLAAATGKPTDRYDAAWSQAASKARGGFAETLDALTVELHERARQHVRSNAVDAARSAAKAVELVEEAKEQVTFNVSPQLIVVNLVRDLGGLLT
jgi:DNA polymerase III subunit delta'